MALEAGAIFQIQLDSDSSSSTIMKQHDRYNTASGHPTKLRSGLWLTEANRWGDRHSKTASSPITHNE